MDEGAAAAPAASPFTQFLDKMKHPTCSNLVKMIRNFTKEFAASEPDAQESERVIAFLDDLERSLAGHALWKTAGEEELENAREGLEKYLMTKTFTRAFNPTPAERTEDEQFSSKCKRLASFIGPDHLDIPQKYRREKAWSMAQAELVKINNYKAPRDKLICILNCCKVVNIHLVHLSKEDDENGSPPGADDFLPVFILVILRAQVPFLLANVNYIRRYRHPDRMVSEAAYHFTNLQSAAGFLQICAGKDFTIDDALYDDTMGVVEANSDLISMLGAASGADGGAWAESEETTHVLDDGNIETWLPEDAASSSTPAAAATSGGSSSSSSAPAEEVRIGGVLIEEGAADGSGSHSASSGAEGMALKFADRDIGDLRVGEVAELLTEHKRLAAAYRALRGRQ